MGNNSQDQELEDKPNFQEILAMIHSPEGKHETQRRIVLFEERHDLERDKVVLYANQVRKYAGGESSKKRA